MYLIMFPCIVGFSTAGQVDSAQGNLASSFVNGFVNCGFGVDKLLTEDGNKWIYKNKVEAPPTPLPSPTLLPPPPSLLCRGQGC